MNAHAVDAAPSSSSEPLVFVVDDDQPMLRAVARLLRTAGLSVETYASPLAFLSRPPHGGPACVILDLQLPDVNGLDVQAALALRGQTPPVVFLSGHGSVPVTVQAMRQGAVDFLEKPVSDRILLEAVMRALDRDARARAARLAIGEDVERFNRLTQREREVCTLVLQGLLNKQVAVELGMTEKTVKVHRARAMRKLGVTSIAALVRLFCRLEGKLDKR